METPAINVSDFRPVPPAEWVSTEWISETYGITRGAIYQAIRLERVRFTRPGGRDLFINEDDAWRMWKARRVEMLIEAAERQES